MTNNPYEPAHTSHLNTKLQPVSRRRWAAIGFAVAFIPVAALGVYGLYADAQYAATLPPNTPRCGNGAMAAMIMIFPISPMLGCFGAGIAFFSAIFYNASATSGGVLDPEDGM